MSRYIEHESVAELFLAGATSGQGWNMRVTMINGLSSIVGYGWAVYAMDVPGRKVVFGDGFKTDNTHVGWAGYSNTTTQHIHQILSAFDDRGVDYTVVDLRPELEEMYDLACEGGDYSAVGEKIVENAVDADELSGWYYDRRR